MSVAEFLQTMIDAAAPAYAAPQLALACAFAFFALLVIAFGSWPASDERVQAASDTAPAPLWWRVGEPLLRPLARWPGALLARADRGRVQAALQLAGLDHLLSPEQLAAVRLALAAWIGVCTLTAFAFGHGLLPSAAGLVAGLCAASMGYALPTLLLDSSGRSRRAAILRELPFHLDLLTLCVEAGMSWTSAIRQLVDKGPQGPLSAEWARVLHDVNAGRVRADALRAMAQRIACPAITSLVAALASADRSGASVAQLLRTQAVQQRSERFHRAESLALQAPTRMLLPLIVCIFPCTFLLLMYPIAHRILEQGLPR